MEVEPFIARILDTYATADLDQDFLESSDATRIENSAVLKEDINNAKSDIKDLLSTHNALDPDDKWAFNDIKNLRRSIKNAKDCIYESDPENDMFVVNQLSTPAKYRIMNKRDIRHFLSNLIFFLQTRAPVTFKIKWILKHKKISDSAFARKVHLYQQQVNYYRRGKRDILKMSLKTALNFEDYYDDYISRQLTKIAKKDFPMPKGVSF